MRKFDPETTDKDFYRGKRYLDSGRYPDAIKVYDELIKQNLQFKDEPEAITLLETSLNNRCMAKCKIGLIRNDEGIYRDGMKDFSDSIAMKENISDEEKQWLTAQHNLSFAEEEVKNFDQKKSPNESNFFKFISN